MLIVLSPAKSLDYKTDFKVKESSEILFAENVEKLIQELKKITISEIEKMMGVSQNLAELNFVRFQNFAKKFDLKNSRQAILAFDGDVYDGIEKRQYSVKNFHFAQKNLLILSGLYGILRPLDLIQPYRLEMGLNLQKSSLAQNLGIKNLYQFWGQKISEFINLQPHETLINLASEEYFLAVNRQKIRQKIIDISFKETKGGVLKIVGISAKKARGLMANFVIKNELKNPQDLQEFALENYRFSPELSSAENYIFIR